MTAVGDGAGGWPVDPAVLPAFLLAMVVLELTPGPNMAYLSVISASRGHRAGIAAVAGVTAALILYLLLSMAVLSGAAQLDPRVLGALRWAGVTFMIWLAIDATRANLATDPAAPTGAEPPGLRDLGRFAASGFAASALNAKVAVFYLAVMPGFIRPGLSSTATQVGLLGALHIAISLVVHAAVVLGAARLVTTLDATGRRVFRFASSGLLLLVAAWLAFSG